jgi:hypothetical protein
MIMTAIEAKELSDKVALKNKNKKELAAEKERIEKEKHKRYIRVDAVIFITKQFNDEWLPKAINQNKRSCKISTTVSQITSNLVKNILVGRGFWTSPTEVIYHDAYSGSVDDGFAYSRDAYTEWIFQVSW